MTYCNSETRMQYCLIACFLALLHLLYEMMALKNGEGSVWGNLLVFPLIDQPTTDASKVDEPHWRQKLCPGGRPDVSLGGRLFSTARDLVLEDSSLRSGATSPTESAEEPFVDFFYDVFYGGCSLYLDPHNPMTSNLLYLRIYKAGNNQIREWMEQTFDEESSFTKGTAVPRAIQAAVQRGLTPSRDLCIVTAIRDPISHFLSGYNEVEGRHERLSQLFEEQHIIPPPYWNLPKTTPVYRKARFRQFVADLLDQHPAFLEATPYEHILSMSRILSALNTLGLRLTSYLPSLSNLSTVWPNFVAETCPGLPGHFTNKPMVLGGQHASSLDPSGTYQASKDVWAEQGAVAKALCMIHAMDYACWDDLPDGVPSLCQEIYERLL